MRRYPVSRIAVFAAGALFALVPLASANPITITITPSVGPSVNDPAFAQYAANSLSGQSSGTSVGNPSADPAAFAPISSLTVAQLVFTGDYNSWMGTANPTGAFAAEHGNALYFGVNIQGNGNTFSLSMLSETVNGTDPNNFFKDAFSFNQSSYSSFLQGITPNGQVITSGPATQIVSQILYVGISLSVDGSKATFTGYPTDQATLNAAILNYNQFANNLTTTYTLATSPLVAPTSNSVTVPLNSTVPEPSTAVIAAFGLAAVLTAAGRQQRSRRDADAA